MLAEIFHPLDFGAWPTTFELGYCQPHGGRDNQISPQWYNRRIHPDSRVHFQSTPLGRILDIPVGAHMSNCCAEDFRFSNTFVFKSVAISNSFRNLLFKTDWASQFNPNGSTTLHQQLGWTNNSLWWFGDHMTSSGPKTNEVAHRRNFLPTSLWVNLVSKTLRRIIDLDFLQCCTDRKRFRAFESIDNSQSRSRVPYWPRDF